MTKFDLNKLPQTITVKIAKTVEGNFIAELPDYEEVFTQASNWEQLDFNVNDLIMVYFDVPKEYHHYIWYRPKESKSEADKIKTPLHFQILLAKNLPNRWQ